MIRESDIIYHLAALPSLSLCEQEPSLAYKSNVLTTRSVANLSSKLKKPTIFFSSVVVNSETPSIYRKNKKDLERAVLSHHTKDFVIIRPYNVYGYKMNEDNPYSGVICKFIKACKKKSGIQITGDGTQTRDFIWVQDLIRGTLKISFTKPYTIIEGGTGIETSIIDLADKVQSVFGKTSVTFVDSNTGVKSSVCQNPLVTPFIKIDQGLKLLTKK
jgi:UDP-glucose 4-epimerase